MNFARNAQQKRQQATRRASAGSRSIVAWGLFARNRPDVLPVCARTIAFHNYSIMADKGVKTSADLLRLAENSSGDSWEETMNMPQTRLLAGLLLFLTTAKTRNLPRRSIQRGTRVEGWFRTAGMCFSS